MNNQCYRKKVPGDSGFFSFGEGGGDSRPPNSPLSKVNLSGLKAGAWSRFILSAVERVNQEKHACIPEMGRVFSLGPIILIIL